MRVIVFVAFMATRACVAVHMSSEERIERSNGEDSFEEKLKEGYNLLKNEPNAEETMRLLKKLHDMEDEMKDGHTLFPKHNADSLNAVKNYMQNRSDYFETMGDTIEQINRNNNVATALFQGDVILTKFVHFSKGTLK
uniref:Secreted RxLR effector peptide protein n=1 Tax=Angiostrongylus cantonensis TaxID=6313 RepID=A0A0K0D7K7_ANGCA